MRCDCVTDYKIRHILNKVINAYNTNMNVNVYLSVDLN